MDFVVKKLLAQATESNRFEKQDNSCLEIWIYDAGDRSIRVVNEPLSGIDDDGKAFDNLSNWLGQQKPFLSPHDKADNRLLGGLRLLVQQGRPEHVIGKPNKLPWKDAETYLAVEQALKLPRFYVPVMEHSSGIAEVFLTPGTAEQDQRLDFVAQNTNYSYDSWSLALSHSYSTRVTTGFFGAQAKMNPASIVKHLIDSAPLAVHPMLLPSILFQKLVESSVSHRENLWKDIQRLEILLDHVNKRKDNIGESVTDLIAKEKLYDASYYSKRSKQLNTCKKQQASRDGRQSFWKQFREVLLTAIDGLNTAYPQQAPSKQRTDVLEASQLELRYWISGNGRIFESIDGHDVNYRTRIEAQLDALYSLITQRDSKLQADIAEASKQDSADMRIIAILGSIFLPANFVATMFSVEKFQLSANSGTLFGIYVALSSTLTIVVLGFAIFRPWWKRRDERLKFEAGGRNGTRKISKENIDGEGELMQVESSFQT